MSSLIRELHMHNAHQDALVSGRVQPVEDDEPAKPRFTYSIEWDDRQTGWYDPGWGVRNDQTGILMNEEPFATERKAQSFLDDLESGE